MKATPEQIQKIKWYATAPMFPQGEAQLLGEIQKHFAPVATFEELEYDEADKIIAKLKVSASIAERQVREHEARMKAREQR